MILLLSSSYSILSLIYTCPSFPLSSSLGYLSSPSIYSGFFFSKLYGRGLHISRMLLIFFTFLYSIIALLHSIYPKISLSLSFPHHLFVISIFFFFCLFTKTFRSRCISSNIWDFQPKSIKLLNKFNKWKTISKHQHDEILRLKNPRTKLKISIKYI